MLNWLHTPASHLDVVVGEVVVAWLVGGEGRGPVLGAVPLALPVPGAGAALLAAAVPQPLACNQDIICSLQEVL